MASEAFDRITHSPDRLDGVPAIRDTRISVATVVAMIDAGMRVEDIRSDFPALDPEDIAQAIAYARKHGSRP